MVGDWKIGRGILTVTLIQDRNGAKSAEGCKNFQASMCFPHPDSVDRLRMHLTKCYADV